MYVPSDPSAEPDWARLSAEERNELAGLVGATTIAPCGRCGCADHELARLTDDQLDRALQLLRALLGPTGPDHGPW